jgi:hypothetical protein
MFQDPATRIQVDSEDRRGGLKFDGGGGVANVDAKGPALTVREFQFKIERKTKLSSAALGYLNPKRLGPVGLCESAGSIKIESRDSNASDPLLKKPFQGLTRDLLGNSFEVRKSEESVAMALDNGAEKPGKQLITEVAPQHMENIGPFDVGAGGQGHDVPSEIGQGAFPDASRHAVKLNGPLPHGSGQGFRSFSGFNEEGIEILSESLTQPDGRIGRKIEANQITKPSVGNFVGKKNGRGVGFFESRRPKKNQPGRAQPPR